MSIASIFKAYDVRATYPDPLNEAAAFKVGYAAAKFLSETAGPDGSGPLLVSRDMRPHAPKLCDALSQGIRAAGCDVVDLGMCDTSFMYFAVNQIEGAIGGIQTTASHNPINYNGFKISAQQAKPVGAATGLKEIEKTAEAMGDEFALGKMDLKGGYSQRDLWPAYREHVLKFLAPLKRKVKVFVDASNGMAGKLVPAVFDGVDNLEIIPLNFEITGSFVHEPNPLVAENMRPTQQGTVEHQADFGACFDGDADRCILCDDKGEICGCDHLTALLAEHFVAMARTDPAVGKPVIAYDLRSSKVVEQTIKSLDATPKKSRVGHVFMKAVLRENKGLFAGELSGHFYFRDNSYADSGAIALASVLSVLGSTQRPLSELIGPFRKYPQSGEMNFEVEDKVGVINQLKEKYAGQAEIDELDGVTIDAFEKQGWWFNVRASNTEPLLRLNAEGTDQAKLDALMKQIQPLLGKPVAGH